MENTQPQPNTQVPGQPVASRGLKKSDIIAILFIGVVFGLVLIPIFRGVRVPIPMSALHVLPVVMPFLALFCLWVMSILGRKRPTLFELGKYAAVGFFNTGVDFGVFNGMVLLTGRDPVGLVAGGFTAVSFTVAVVNSYCWNKYWTFNKRGSTKKGEFMQFVIVSLIGLIINFAYVSGMTKYIAAPYNLDAQQWANLVKVTGIFISLAWNFAGYKYIVFRKRG